MATKSGLTDLVPSKMMVRSTRVHQDWMFTNQQVTMLTVGKIRPRQLCRNTRKKIYNCPKPKYCQINDFWSLDTRTRTIQQSLARGNMPCHDKSNVLTRDCNVCSTVQHINNYVLIFIDENCLQQSHCTQLLGHTDTS